MRYIHLSDHPHPPGTIFGYRGQAYVELWGETDFYQALEHHRPSHCIGHHEGVFFCRSIEDADLCGGCPEYVLVVEPLTAFSWHDINWSSEISCLIGDGYDIDSEPVKRAANAYWSGIAHDSGESVWEGIARKAKVVKAFEESVDDEVIEKTLNN